MECKSEIKDEIDIEEDNIFDNPHLRKIFPGIGNIKQELDEEAPMIASETWVYLQTKQEGVGTTINGNRSSAATKAGLLDISKCVDDMSSDDGKEEQSINNSQEFELILKKEILTCNVCSKESEEEMCKQCARETVENAPCSPSDSIVFHVIDKPKKPFVCDICPYTAFEKSDLEQHALKHTDVSYKVTSKKHVKSKHSILFCDICGYGCPKSQLIGHLRKHTGEKPYECGLCDYTCSQGFSLKYHIRSKHTNEKNYSCHMCEYKSVTVSHLIQHLRVHTGEKPYKCDLCGYTCSQSSSLKYHIKAKHNKEKNYSCNVCEYKTVTKSHLSQHLRIHTGEKPYKCDLCGYTCSQGSSLKYHIKAKHTNEKNYSCNVCEYKSFKKSNLTTHLRRHNKVKP